MKKAIKYIVIFLVFFFCANDDMHVKAVGHDLIYDIESLKLGSTSLVIKGFSFIDHYDNYGGHNLETYIIASTSSSVEKIKSNNSHEFKTNVTAKDLYATRCTNNGCDSETRDDKIKNKEIDDDCSNHPGASRCSYYNVGFEVTITYESIYSALGEVDDIYFYIRSTVRHGGGVYKTITLPIGVNSKVLSVSSGSCTSDSVCNLGNYSFTLGKLSNKVKMTAVSARIIGDNFGYIKSGHYFNPSNEDPSSEYVFSEYIIGGSITKENDDGTSFVTSSGLSYYKLNVDHCYSSGDSTYRPGDKCSYYAYSSWVQVTGHLKISKLRENVVQTKCDKISDWSGTKKNIDNTVSCGEPTSYESCTDVDKVSATVYFESRGSFTKGQCVLRSGEYFENKCYLPITVTASVSILERGKYTLGAVSSSSVKNGQPFNFSSSTYENSVFWINNKKRPNGEAYYSYKVAKDYSCSSTKCVVLGSVNISQVSSAYYNGKKYGSLSKASEVAIADAVYKKIDYNINLLNEMYSSNSFSVSEFPGSWVLDETKVVGYDGRISGKTGDGNTSKFNVNKISASFKYSLNDGYLNIKDTSISYDEAKSSDSDYINFGKRLYVPLKFKPDSSYTINLKKLYSSSSTGISFVEGIKWGITGSCSVKVVPGLFECPDGDCSDVSCDSKTQICDLSLAVRYRTIAVDDPFPRISSDSDLPANWLAYKNEFGNFERIANSYNNYPNKPDYRYTGKFNWSDQQAYTSWNNMNFNGTSSFLTLNNFNLNVNSSNYCKLGEFDNSCDKVN